MRVMVLAANFITIPYPVYPLGAATAAETARRHGHEVKLLDLMAENGFGGYNPELIKQAVSDFQPDCLGLSLRNLESADSSNADEHWSLDLVKQIITDIRRFTDAPVVMGGAGFSLMPGLILEHTGADYGLIGEGEDIWPEFLETLAQNKFEAGSLNTAVPGATQISHYDPALVRRYLDQGGLIGVQSKRGCPLKCLYCSYPLLEGRRIRPRPIEEVLADIEQLCAIIEKPPIAFADAVFNDPAGHWRTLLEAIAARGLKISWTAFFQPAEFQKGDLELIKASGAAGLEFGTDASNDAALKGLNKSFDFNLVREIQEKCAAAQIPTAHYIIFGGPGETPATVEEGIANLDQLPGCVAFISTGLSIYPGTPLFALAREEGLIETANDLKHPLFYYSPAIDPGWLDARLQKAFGLHRDRLYPPSRAIERTVALRRMGFRGILWDTLIGAGERSAKVSANA